MNSADPHEPGQSANPWTTFFPSTEAQDMCLTFWYSMTASDTGTLPTLQVRPSNPSGFLLIGRGHLLPIPIISTFRPELTKEVYI